MFCAGSVVAGDKVVSEIIKFQNDTLTIQAQNTPLIKILSEIQAKCLVKIIGLEKRNDETITYFSKEGSVERVLKDFLRYLGEKNYAFEYSNEKLLRISVLPWAKSGNVLPEAPPHEEESSADTLNVIKVVDIIEGSQAQSLGLMKGDIILEYNGLQIRSTDELIKATKMNTGIDQVEMLVLRENYPLRFVLNGGFIGVRISNVTIPKEALEIF